MLGFSRLSRPIILRQYKSNMHIPSGNNIAGFLLSLSAAFLWGVLPVAIKEIIFTMDAFTLVWFRFLFAAVVLSVILLIRGQLPPLASARRSTLMLLMIAGAGLCANYSLFSLSLNYVNAETSEAIIQLTTLFLLLGGVLVFHEPFLRIQKVGAVLILAGMILFFNDRYAELLAGDSQLGLGVLLVVAASVTWVIYALLQKQLLNNFTAMQILLMVYILSTLLLLPLIKPSSALLLSPLQLFLVFFCCINTVLAYGAFGEALVHWHASKVSAVLALAPLFTIVTLKLVVWINPAYSYSDNLNVLSILAAIVLVAGSVIVALVPLLPAWRSRRRAGS